MSDLSRFRTVRPAFILGVALFALSLSFASSLSAQEEPVVVEAPQEVPQPEAPESPAAVADDEAGAEAPEADEDDDDGIRISITDSRRHRRSVDKDTQVHFGRELIIREDEVAREAIVFMGSLDVRGKVIGDAVSIFGPLNVDGEVTGEVVAVGADVILGPDAVVTGDIASVGGIVERHPDAQVLGQISEIDFGPAFDWSEMPRFWHYGGPEFWNLWYMGTGWSLFWTVFKWVMLILLVSLIFVVAREPIERTSRQLRAAPWKSSLLGLVALVFFPFVFATVCVILAITIVGIPLLIVFIPLVILLLLLALLLGYTSAAYSIGNWLGRRVGWSLPGPYAALALGVVAIQIVSLMARIFGGLGGPFWFFAMLFGISGWFIRFVAWTSGFGAALLTQLGRLDPVAAAVAPASSSVPAMPSPEAGDSSTSVDSPKDRTEDE